MENKLIKLFEEIKQKIQENMDDAPLIDKEIFYTDLAEWAEAKYEETQLISDIELQNYED